MSISESCHSVEISCHSNVGVLSPGGCLGRSRSLEARTDDDDVDSFSSFNLRNSYTISAGCVSSPGAIFWCTDLELCQTDSYSVYMAHVMFSYMVTNIRTITAPVKVRMRTNFIIKR